MKASIVTSFLAVVASGLALGAETAYTTPVGYVSLGNTTNGANNIPANSDIVVSVPMLKPALYSGLVASVASNTVTASGSPGFANLTTTPHVLVIESGIKSGLIAPITSFTTTTVTVDPGVFTLTDVAGNDSYTIRPAWTLSTFMSGASSLTGVKVFGFSNSQLAINNSASELYFYVGGGWENGDGDPADNVILYPGEGFIVRTGSTPVADFVISGEVPKAKSYIAIGQKAGGRRDTFFSYVSPASEPLGQSGLGFTSGDILLDFNNTVTGQNKSGIPYFYVGGGNWENGDGDSANGFLLESGKAYIFRRASAATNGYLTSQDTQSYSPSL